MLYEVQRVAGAVFAARSAGVARQTEKIREVPDESESEHRYYHPKHEPTERLPGQARHQQHARVGRERALRDMAEPACDEGLFLRVKIAVGRALHDIRAEYHSRGGWQQPDEERSTRGVHATVVEKPVEVELRELYLAARFEHPLEIGDEIERDEHRKGVPIGEHPHGLAQYRPRRDAVEQRRRDERAEYGLIKRTAEREEDNDHKKDDTEKNELHTLTPSMLIFEDIIS